MKIEWWTVGLQAVNVLILLWLLHRFLYRPIRGVLDQRQQQTTLLLQQAGEARSQGQAERTALEAERRELAKSRRNVEADAHAAIVAERDRLLAGVQAEAEERARVARAALEAERHLVEAALLEEASRLAVDIARRLLDRLPKPAVLAAFLDGACAQLNRLPRGSVPGMDDEIELVSALALNDAEQGLCRERLRAVFGTDEGLRFGTDPALIAGIELRLPHAVVRSHWANDLSLVLERLNADARAA